LLTETNVTLQPETSFTAKFMYLCSGDADCTPVVIAQGQRHTLCFLGEATPAMGGTACGDFSPLGHRFKRWLASSAFDVSHFW
jgi:hypothetical protein